MKQVIEIPDGHELVKEGNTYTIKEVSKYPTSWEDVNNPSIYIAVSGNEERFNKITVQTDNTVLINALFAQVKIYDLLKAYNGDWEADYTDGTVKYVIYLNKNIWEKETNRFTNEFLTFKTEEARDHFLEHHIELLNQYKPLAG